MISYLAPLCNKPWHYTGPSYNTNYRSCPYTPRTGMKFPAVAIIQYLVSFHVCCLLHNLAALKLASHKDALHELSGTDI